MNDFYVKAIQEFDSENWERSIELFSASIKIDPIFEAYFHRGIARSNIKKWVEAIDDFNFAIGLRPNGALSDQAFHMRGVSKGSLKNFLGAIEDFNSALNINPANQDFLLSRGLTFLQLGDRNKALPDLRRASELGSYKAKTFLQMFNL